VEAIAWISSRKDLVAAAFALTSLLGYLRYRKGGSAAIKWYFVSVLLFLLGVAGKLSVATFPAVFLAHDLFIERRPLKRSLLDKVPFLVAAGMIALVVASAQPSTGVHPSPDGLLAALVQNLWLLTGFGTYVIYRTHFGSTSLLLQFISVAILIAIFVAPLLISRRAPIATVLIYWILFTLIPSQVLSFAYPVADRYLFFPSVAAAVLIAWGVMTMGQRLGRQGSIGAVILLLALGSMWARTTITYVSEWRDPRSVWYAASAKSSDPLVFYNLGWQYLDISAGLGKSARKPRPSEADLQRLASAIWKSDPRFPGLLSEWSQSQRGGAMETEFQRHLRTLAQQEFDRALSAKGRHIMADLYLRRGLLLLDQDDLQGARREFLAAVDEASRSSFTEGRQEVLVNTYNDLGIVAWRQTNYSEALHWLRLAEEEQTRSGSNWLPDLTANRKRLEAIIASSSSQ
jgi:tetratricopeptide (TPR) repeat protein